MVEVAAPLAQLQCSNQVTEKGVHDVIYAASGERLVTGLVTGYRLSASAQLGFLGVISKETLIAVPIGAGRVGRLQRASVEVVVQLDCQQVHSGGAQSDERIELLVTIVNMNDRLQKIQQLIISKDCDQEGAFCGGERFEAKISCRPTNAG